MSVTIDNDKLEKRILDAYEKLDGASFEVGIFGGKNKTTKTSIAFYALVNEFGMKKKKNNRKIPQRSFMRSTVDENLNSYHNNIDKLLNNITKGTDTPHSLLIKMAIMLEGDIKRKIINFNTPANAESTQWAKGKYRMKVDNPLIDTGAMLAAVTHKVNIK